MYEGKWACYKRLNGKLANQDIATPIRHTDAMSQVIQRRYTVRFLSPAFLGNAEQAAEWRTPPFKALLRQWWRVAVAAECNFDHRRVREREARLFGHAWFKEDRDAREAKVAARRSRVHLRLSRWELGRLRDWSRLDDQRVRHPEVKYRDGKPIPVGAQLYLGFGPLTTSRGTTALQRPPALQAGETATMSLVFPAENEDELACALRLMDLYGTVGGRCRNGWGSLSIVPADDSTPPLDGSPVLREWRDALELDWPHALGADDARPLIWQTNPQHDWRSAMAQLAEIKIGLRTQFEFNRGRSTPQPEDRHWLSYPVTNHRVPEWDRQGLRLPNSLRFKLREDPAGKLRGIIFHVPCCPPPQFRPVPEIIQEVWQRVHAFLDAPAQQLDRIPL